MSAFMKSKMRILERRIILFAVLVIASLITPVFAQGISATLLTEENKQKIELAVWRYAIDTPLLLETIDWFRDLTRNSQESAAIAELSRLEFMIAQLERDKNRRVQLFERCIVIADRSLALNANDVRGLFWKAVAMGKMAEDSGMVNALRMLRPMEKMLLTVVALEEK